MNKFNMIVVAWFILRITISIWFLNAADFFWRWPTDLYWKFENQNHAVKANSNTSSIVKLIRMGSLHGRVDPLAARLLAFLWLLSNRQRKARSGLSSMTKREDVLPQLIFCDLYLALFESHLRYDNVVWCSISSSELQARAKSLSPIDYWAHTI